jgi:uncharacterized protein YgbK (DUF1537 family)
MRTTILADDLTGACDTGCLFAGRGAVGVIAEPTLTESDAAAVAVDTESRALVPAEAARRLRGAASRQQARLAAGRAFKKIDSTMRGPVGAELAALLAAGIWKRALLCPAFPAQGRVVREGLLRVNGALAHESPVGRDRHYPGPTSDVAAMLEPALARPATRLPLAAVRAGVAGVRERLAAATGDVIVADAETDTDLEVLARAAAREPALLVAGAAGLGRAFATALGYPPAHATPPRSGAWLWVVGSRHAASRAQLETLAAAGAPAAVVDPAGGADLGAVTRALRRGAPACLTSDPAAELAPAAVAAALGAAAARVLVEAPLDCLAITGGETAFAVIGALGAMRLDLTGAPGDGLALGTLDFGPASPAAMRRLPLLTKAGGFGDAHLFLRLPGGLSS